MPLLPGRETISQECLEICALAQARFVSPDNFTTLPYLQNSIEAQAEQLLIEKLLAAAIKTRFLDDKTSILKAKDRRLLTIGRYFENGVPNDQVICIRHALNKLVHHQSISIAVVPSTVNVFSAPIPTPESRRIPVGTHDRESVIVSVDGKYQGSTWQFDIDLFTLLNEMIRILE
ncbi:MAG: hypothetical protein ACREO7_05820 [Pseudoxanthomonas sp.]